jgi:two-component system, NarL family, response regulator EvgA
MAGKAIVVDDHPAFRASARRLLEVSGYEVVAEAGDGASALALTRELNRTSSCSISRFRT